MGFRYYSKTQDKYQHIYDDVNRTNNNGLAFTIAILEEIYTNPDYPHNTGLPGPKTADTPNLPGNRENMQYVHMMNVIFYSVDT